MTSRLASIAAEKPVQEKPMRAKLIKQAVRRSKMFKEKGLSEQVFAQLFSGLVYSQIWEDPLVDLEAMAIKPHHHIITIASGGCNVVSYLTANPGKITAVDLNRAHVALTRTKLCAAKYLPDWKTFYSLFAVPQRPENKALYEQDIKPYLDTSSQRYWQGRDASMRNRTRYLTGNIYHHGLLGRFIGLCHKVAKRYKLDFSQLLEAKTRQEQIDFFETKLAPLLDKKLIKWLTSHPSSLYGLGIPPAQYEALAACADGNMHQVLRDRLAKLCCDFDINENYFAWQAFGRHYGGTGQNALPPYLQERYFETISSQTQKVSVHQTSITDKLRAQAKNSVDRVVLLDAQDWMDDETLNDLWQAITQAAAPKARVIFRTAGFESILPGRVKEETLSRWTYHKNLSQELNKKDRSAIYGGFHIYEFNG